MSTIPASDIVDVIPDVIEAGGSSFVLNGLMLTTSIRVPIGTVMAFPSESELADFFGGEAAETTEGAIYFNGFDGSALKPGTLLVAQYNTADVAAYLRGGDISQVSLTTLQSYSGNLNVVVDGYPRTGSDISLSAASSFSSAAGIIETALNSVEPTEASVTASFGATATGDGSSTNLTLSSVVGFVSPGDGVAGTGVPSNTVIVSQTSGTTGSDGVYVTNNATTASSAAITVSSNILDVTEVISGTLAVGQTLTGSTVTAGTVITALGTGSGGIGTYITSHVQEVASETITGVATDLTVTYDSQSGAFIITSGITGIASTMAFATGPLAPLVLMTSATGAVLSQGAAAATPGSFMDALVNTTQDWVTFFTIFDPDDGDGNDQKFAFATWTNSQGKKYAYACWDTDASPTVTVPASSSLGQRIKAAALSGTCLFWVQTGADKSAFTAGYPPSLDFDATNGRFDFCFRAQSGLIADVSDQTTANNLLANYYNYYGAYASRANAFIRVNNGSVSGSFLWFDSYINQIWFNDAIQVAWMSFLGVIGSVPYDFDGYASLEQALADPINAALNFGAIRTGVTLSSSQIAAVKAAAGIDISQTLFDQGWYLQIKDPGATVRQNRGSPVCKLWYTDGGSVQVIDLSSLLIQ